MALWFLQQKNYVRIKVFFICRYIYPLCRCMARCLMSFAAHFPSKISQALEICRHSGLFLQQLKAQLNSYTMLLLNELILCKPLYNDSMLTPWFKFRPKLPKNLDSSLPLTRQWGRRHHYAHVRSIQPWWDNHHMVNESEGPSFCIGLHSDEIFSHQFVQAAKLLYSCTKIG